MSYRIQSGDTLSALAQRFGTSVQSLAQANGIQNVDLIISGASLQVPGATDGFDAGSGTSAGQRVAGSTSPGGISTDGIAGDQAQRLAEIARRTATAMGTTGWCAKGVGDAMDAAGIPYQRVASAYQAADLLARNSNFREVSLRPGEAPPAGAVIVHPSMYNGSQVHGHIAISLGNGQEASDHVQSMITSPNQRVFIPVG